MHESNHIFHHGCKCKHFIFSHIITLKRLSPPPPPPPHQPHPTPGLLARLEYQVSKTESIYRKSTTRERFKKYEEQPRRKRIVLAEPSWFARRQFVRVSRRVPRSLTPSRTRRGGTGTPSGARHGAQRGARSAARLPPRSPRPAAAPRFPFNSPRARLRAPHHLPCRVRSPRTQARQLGRAASAAMTATQEAPRCAKAPRSERLQGELPLSARLSVRSPESEARIRPTRA